jgi:hypothetical protein
VLRFEGILLGLALSAASLPALAQDAGDAGGIFLPGTQPGTLTQDLRAPTLCESCHGGYADYSANDTWKGTMMANAARDPLFHAALTVANQDAPGSGDLCLRCHSPRGWLFGRSSPPVIENLEPEDFESVQCDFCHRLTRGPTGTPYIGNAQYFVADDFVRRGPLEDPLAPHEWEYSEYHSESELCGLCHDVSNPLENGFAIERTYTEWKSSAFEAEGQSCQSCHMPAERGKACGAPGMPERDVHRHELAGGNYWMPLVLAGEHPELGRQQAFERTAENAKRMLSQAALVTLELPQRIPAGQALAFHVRVENLTGHKLPTGYPEGRRSWLEVTVRDADGSELLHSGGYDSATATRSNDPALRRYEVRMAADGVEGFHFILQNQLLEDSRIPPRGFVPRPDTLPVGRSYALPNASDAGDVLAHWDRAPYDTPVPADARGPLSVRATLWYQTTSREYVEALRDANTTDARGERMFELWQRYDRAPPFAMASSEGVVALDPSPDGAGGTAGTSSGSDAGMDASAAGASPAGQKAAQGDAGGCACQNVSPWTRDRSRQRLGWVPRGPSALFARSREALWLIALIVVIARRKSKGKAS